MKLQQIIPQLTLAGVMLAGVALPGMAMAQSDLQRAAKELQKQVDHRQSTKNDWRNLGYVGGAVGLYGLLKHDNNLAALGIGGGLYSAYRYEQDRKSQSKSAKARAHLFSQRSFDYEGHHYVRHSVRKNGKTFYKFSRVAHR